MVTGAALAAASTDTFADIGTITMRPSPGVIHGFIVNGTANANTAAEAYQQQFRFNLGELGLKEMLLTGPCNVGEGVATQSVGFGGPARFVAASIPYMGNEDIDCTFAHHGPAPTAGSNVQAAILYSEAPHPPQEWIARLPNMFGSVGSDSEANAAVTADNTAITDLQIPSFARHICGFGCGASQDAAGRTAEDAVIALDFSSTFPDFTPQIYPFLWKYPNLAGTLVGQGIDIPTVTFPAWIPTTGVSGQITPTVDLVTAVTDAHSISADVFYTNK
jgi:hypothetical protein